MIKRYWWKESTNGVANFTWQPTSNCIAFNGLEKHKNFKQMVNHFEGHSAITTKTGLIKNLSIYCEVSLSVPYRFFFHFNLKFSSF